MHTFCGSLLSSLVPGGDERVTKRRARDFRTRKGIRWPCGRVSRRQCVDGRVCTGGCGQRATTIIDVVTSTITTESQSVGPPLTISLNVFHSHSPSGTRRLWGALENAAKITPRRTARRGHSSRKTSARNRDAFHRGEYAFERQTDVQGVRTFRVTARGYPGGGGGSCLGKYKTIENRWRVRIFVRQSEKNSGPRTYNTIRSITARTSHARDNRPRPAADRVRCTYITRTCVRGAYANTSFHTSDKWTALTMIYVRSGSGCRVFYARGFAPPCRAEKRAKKKMMGEKDRCRRLVQSIKQ